MRSFGCFLAAMMPLSRGKCAQFMRKEFHWSRLWFNHWDWKSFTHSPWLPHTVNAQWIYLLYRAVVSFYFLVWLLAININVSSPNILIYLTQWSFISLNAYLLVSLITTSFNFILVYVYPKKKHVKLSPDSDDDDDDDDDDDGETKKCGSCSSGDRTTCYDKLTWLLFLIGTESAFLTVLLFWTLIGNNADGELSVSVNVHVHILNGVVALLEVWVTGIPIHLLHFIYMLLFAGTYGIFTGVYYGVNGTGYNNERYIYPILDYGSQPGIAVGTFLITALVVCPLVHVVFYVQYRLRHWLTNLLQHRVRIYRRYLNLPDMSVPIPVLD